MDIANFADIETEFMARVSKMVWCNVASTDTQNRPRSRVLHPIWEGATGWIATRANSHKAKHIAHNPYLSLAYIADIAKPVYVDCRAEWIEDPATKSRIWELIHTTPEPVGYDPTPIFKSVDNLSFGLLKLTPWRIELYSFPAASLVWRNNH